MSDTAPAAPTLFSYSAIWRDAGRMLSSNAGLITAIAGAFLFLPAVLEARYFPPPAEWYDSSEWLELMRLHIRENWLWLLLSTTATLTGTIALYLLLLASPRLTVANAMVKSFAIMPFYIVLSVVTGVAVMLGLFLLIVPAIFLIGKFALATPILVNETPRAPFSAIARSWERSKGRTWLIAGLVITIYFAAMLVGLAVRVGLGTVILLVFEQEGAGAMLLAFLHGLVVTGLVLLVILLLTALYRALTPRPDFAKPAA